MELISESGEDHFRNRSVKKPPDVPARVWDQKIKIQQNKIL